MNGLCFVFLTKKEPVHKSHLSMKPTLGALRARAIIVHIVKYLFFLPLFSVTLLSQRLESNTRNTAYIYIVLCDNSSATPVDPPLAVSTEALNP